MTYSERDISVLRHIIQYCAEIDSAIITYGLTLEKVETDSFCKNALAMSILQIGELVNVLSQEFKDEHDTMAWREIKRMRDRAAHHYIDFHIPTLWETVMEDIGPLKEFCLMCISEQAGANT